MQPISQLSFKKFIPAILWLIVILVLVLIPGNQLPESEFLFKIDFDKFVHAGIFGLLVVLSCWPFYKTTIPRNKKINWFIAIALFTSAFGYSTELMQKYWAQGRNYDLMDWLADSAGALGGYIFTRLVFLKKKMDTQS